MNKTTTTNDNPQEYSVVMIPLEYKVKANRKLISSFMHIVEGGNDSANSPKNSYQLENILSISLLLAMKGKLISLSYADSYIDINAPCFKKLKLIDGKNTSSYEALAFIYKHFDAKELRELLLLGSSRLFNKIAGHAPARVKAKTRGKADAATSSNNSELKNDTNTLKVFNILNDSSSLCMESELFKDNSDGVSAFNSMLKIYQLKNTMVTADAGRFDKETAELISSKGGLYTFKLSDKHSELIKHMSLLMDEHQNKCLTKSVNDCDYEVFMLDFKAVELEFPDTRAFVRKTINKSTEHNDSQSQVQYFISSAYNVQLIIDAIDTRGNVESGRHCVNYLKLPDAYDGWYEDSFNIEKNCSEVRAIFNNMEYAVYRLAAGLFYQGKMQDTRILYSDKPEKLIALIAPLTKTQNLAMMLKDNLRGMKRTKTKS